jgi:N-acetylglutamate synthase/N-acetylornithine aminotransferase
MTEFDFEARRKERSEAQTETLREQNEIHDLLNQKARKLADSIEKYGESRCAIEVTVEGNEIVVTKKMTGVFLKINLNYG